MAIATIPVVVPPFGDGPSSDISTLVGAKTVTLTGLFQGAYVLLASHDDATYVPVLTFDSNGLESVRQTLADAFKFVRVRTVANTVPGGGVTMEVAGLQRFGENFFAVLATFPPGAGGTSVVVDTAGLFPPTGLEQEMDFICAGGFAGSLVVEGGNDGASFNPVGTFQAGERQRPLVGLLTPLEFEPLSTGDNLRYLRLTLNGQATSPVTVTFGGRIPAAGGGGAGIPMPVFTSDSGGATLQALGQGVISAGSSIVLIGDGNTLDTSSPSATVVGNALSVTQSPASTILGQGLTAFRSNQCVIVGSGSSAFQAPGSVLVGTGNNVGSVSGSSFCTVVGSGNTIGDGSSSSSIYGVANTINQDSSGSLIVGGGNTIGDPAGGNAVNNSIIGTSSTIADGTQVSAILGGSTSSIGTGSSNSLVVGPGSSIGDNSPNTLVVGSNSLATDTFVVVIGSSAKVNKGTVTAISSIAIGQGATVGDPATTFACAGDIAIGSGASAFGTSVISIGAAAAAGTILVDASGSVVLGAGAVSTTTDAVAAGTAATVSSSSSTAIGFHALVDVASDSSLAIGPSSLASDIATIALGLNARVNKGIVTARSSIAIGNGAVVGNVATTFSCLAGLALGDGATAFGVASVAIGQGAAVGGVLVDASESVAIGHNAVVTDMVNVALGSGAVVNKGTVGAGGSLAIGAFAVIGSPTTAISCFGSVAVGNGAVAFGRRSHVCWGHGRGADRRCGRQRGHRRHCSFPEHKHRGRGARSPGQR